MTTTDTPASSPEAPATPAADLSAVLRADTGFTSRQDTHAPQFAEFVPAPSSIPLDVDYPEFDEAAFRESLWDERTPPAPDIPASFNVDRLEWTMIPVGEHAALSEKLAPFTPGSPAYEAAEQRVLRGWIADRGARFRAIREARGKGPAAEVAVELTTEIMDLQRQIVRASDELAEVARYDTDENGNPKPVMKLGMADVRARQAIIVDCERQLRLKMPGGAEANARVKEAVEDSIRMAKALHEQARLEHHIQRETERLVLERRVRAAASRRADMRATDLAS